MSLSDALGGVGAWAGGLMAEDEAKSQEQKVLELLQQSMDEYGRIDPNVLKQLTAVTQGDTEFDKIKEDPALRGAQMKALQQLQDVANQGGMTAIDRARLNDINNGLNQQQQARRQAMMTGAAQRGQMGSGLMYANMLGSEQAAAEAASQQGFNVQAEAQKRALEAMQNAGRLGGDIRGQDYGIARDRAGAQDRINQYNSELRNKMNQYNNDTLQQNMQNKMNLAGARTGLRQNQGAYWQNKANQTREQAQAGGRAIMGTLGAAGDVAMAVGTGGASTAADGITNAVGNAVVDDGRKKDKNRNRI